MGEMTEELKDEVSSNGSGGSGLPSKGVVIPAVATAATAAAAGLAVTKGPDVLKKLKGEVGKEGEEIGKQGLDGVKKGLESGGPAGKLASKLIGGSGRGGGQGAARRAGSRFSGGPTSPCP